MKRLFIVIFMGFVVLCNFSSGYGKGSPNRIVVLAGRTSSYEIKDKQTLQLFDPWSGEIIDWSKGAVAAPADVSRLCKVFFYMKWSGRHSNYDRGNLKMIYTVMYLPPGDGQRGYVYLPGRGEEFFQNNIGTIIRDDHDGKWHQASYAWDKAMSLLLSRKD